MKTFTRNVLTFSAEIHPGTDELEACLPKFSSEPMAPAEKRRAGFVPLVDDRVVLPIVSGWATGLRIDTKAIPPSAVKREVERRAQAIVTSQGFYPGRKQLREVKEAAIEFLTTKALARSVVVPVLYSTRSKKLYIAGPQNVADNVTGLLVQALQAVEFKTVVIDEVSQGLTARLARHLDGDDEAFEALAVGGEIVLENREGRRWAIRQESSEQAPEALREAMSDKAVVSSIQLLYAPYVDDTRTISFRFTNKLRVAGVKHDTVDAQAFEGDLIAEKIGQLTVELANLDGIWRRLLELFDPKTIQGAADLAAPNLEDLF